MAGALTGPAAAAVAGAAVSATDPQAWHSPHRPTHLAASHPHSEQRKLARARPLPRPGWIGLVVMHRTLGEAADNGAGAARRGAARRPPSPVLVYPPATGALYRELERSRDARSTQGRQGRWDGPWGSS